MKKKPGGLRRARQRVGWRASEALRDPALGPERFEPRAGACGYVVCAHEEALIGTANKITTSLSNSSYFCVSKFDRDAEFLLCISINEVLREPSAPNASRPAQAPAATSSARARRI